MVFSITSVLEVDTALGEFVINDLPSAGLHVPSRVKSFVSTIDSRIIKYAIGSLGADDRVSLQRMLKTLFVVGE
jgi:hypothetical protein